MATIQKAGWKKSSVESSISKPVNGSAAPSAAAPALPGAADGESSGAADRLLSAHKEAAEAPVKRGRGRPPGSKTRPQSEAPASAPASSFLPPATSLSEVMGSGTGIFYATLASLYDDEDWLVTDTVKKEMGNILSWMLADDFYKIGGLGKYIVGSVMFLSVFSIQASKTAKTRRARRLEAQRRLHSAQPGRGPGNPAPINPNSEHPTPGGSIDATVERRTLAGFVASATPEPPKN